MSEVVNAILASLVFDKVDQKEGFTIYAALTPSALGDGHKQYFLAFVPTHLAVLNRARLHELNWQNVQSRSIAKGYRITPQKWDMPRNIADPIFTMQSRERDYSSYTSDVPVEMLLLNDVKKHTKYQHHNRVSLSGALATFSCVINLLSSSSSSAPPDLEFIPDVT